jgi:hypothetical protein
MDQIIVGGTETFDPSAGDTARQSKLMEAMDEINQAMGKRTLFYACSGIRQKWSGAATRKSPPYTTDWYSLIQVKAT